MIIWGYFNSNNQRCFLFYVNPGTGKIRWGVTGVPWADLATNKIHMAWKFLLNGSWTSMIILVFIFFDNHQGTIHSQHLRRGIELSSSFSLTFLGELTLFFHEILNDPHRQVPTLSPSCKWLIFHLDQQTHSLTQHNFTKSSFSMSTVRPNHHRSDQIHGFSWTTSLKLPVRSFMYLSSLQRTVSLCQSYPVGTQLYHEIIF